MSANDFDRLIAAITVDAYGDAEQATAFCEAFAHEVELPGSATLLGVEVEVTGFDCGDERRGVVARCRREGVQLEISVADLRFPADAKAAWIQAAHRRWPGTSSGRHADGPGAFLAVT